jgi:hypothetical protein
MLLNSTDIDALEQVIGFGKSSRRLNTQSKRIVESTQSWKSPISSKQNPVDSLFGHNLHRKLLVVVKHQVLDHGRDMAPIQGKLNEAHCHRH